MSRPDTPAERAYVAARLTELDHRLDRQREAMMADLDTYRDDWSTQHAEMQRQHQERVREMEADHRAWLDRWLAGDPDEGRPANVDQDRVEASAAGWSSPASPPGPGPGQQLISAAELAEAEAIKNMSMAEYAALRGELGVRSPEDMNRLFGETQR